MNSENKIRTSFHTLENFVSLIRQGHGWAAFTLLLMELAIKCLSLLQSFYFFPIQ